MSQLSTFNPKVTPGSGSVFTLTANSGGAVGPDGSGNINVVGNTTNIVDVGVPGTNTITIAISNSPSITGTTTSSTGFVATTGNVLISAGNLDLPNTNTSGTAGEIQFGGNRWISNYGTANTFVGESSGNTSLTVISADFNTGIGKQSLSALTTGDQNAALGYQSLVDCTSGNSNTALGDSALPTLLSGSNNIAVGKSAGLNYVGAESGNILIGAQGTAAESNITRIGFIGGSSSQTECFIDGIDGVSISTPSYVTINATGQLGSASIPTAFAWHDVTGGSATLAAQNGYIADSASLTTFTLPTNNSFGDTILIVGKGSGGWKIVYTTGQNIIFGNAASTVTTGNIASTNANDCVTLICTTASATVPIFTINNAVGNINIT